MIESKAKLGPADRGRRMTLEEFAHAEGAPGYQYELRRGEVLVVEVPGLPHALLVQAVRETLQAHKMSHPNSVFLIAGGSECALRLPGMQSERHPDIAVYLTTPPDAENPWEVWCPDIVVEVVSAGADARDRDYVEKRDEYLRAGVREYWILDRSTKSFLVLRRRGDSWQEIVCAANAPYRTGLLPGYRLEAVGLFGQGE